MCTIPRIGLRWADCYRNRRGFRRLGIAGLATVVWLGASSFADRGVALAAPGGEEPHSAASSPSDRPPAASQSPGQQPAAPPSTAQQPAAAPPLTPSPAAPGVASPAGRNVSTSGCLTYQYVGRRLRPRMRYYYVAPPSTPSPTAPPAPQTAAPPAQSKPGGAAKASPEATSDRYAWKSLFDGKTLGSWKPIAFGGEGEVHVRDGMIVMDTGNSMTGITWTGPLPRDNYELTLEGMRLSGADFFCTTTFPVGKDPCSLVVGGWGGTVVGLSNVDYFDASENPTTSFQSFEDNRWYRVRIRVTPAKVEAWLNEEQLIDQPREDHKFDIRFEVDLCQPLGIATWCTRGAVRNIRLRELPATSTSDE